MKPRAYFTVFDYFITEEQVLDGECGVFVFVYRTENNARKEECLSYAGIVTCDQPCALTWSSLPSDMHPDRQGW
jgi:hypothetical protein